MNNLIEKLEKQLRLPLPGKEAQYKMSHALRKYYAPPSSDVRIACVLALLFPKDRDWHLVLIERESSNPNDRHGGQIGFPGGKYEESDGTFKQGALREAEEEVGIKPEDVKILGRLTELYIPVSNFLVHPFVGYMDYHPKLKPQESEVKATLEVPFSLFQNPDIVRTIDLKISENITLNKVPFYDVNGKMVWGATAMMISELTAVVGT